MTRLTFGVSESCFAAIMSAKQNAVDHCSEFPSAAKIVRKSFYVDDGLIGADGIDEAIELRKEMLAFFSHGFLLSKVFDAIGPVFTCCHQNKDTFATTLEANLDWDDLVARSISKVWCSFSSLSCQFYTASVHCLQVISHTQSLHFTDDYTPVSHSTSPSSTLLTAPHCKTNTTHSKTDSTCSDTNTNCSETRSDTNVTRSGRCVHFPDPLNV
uniref:Reverse transcriptase domain-containing protein n=1 Tax=Amphimedon queenslandica TaxID=400682 RepID=A0A1X7VK90_AMPQE